MHKMSLTFTAAGWGGVDFSLFYIKLLNHYFQKYLLNESSDSKNKEENLLLYNYGNWSHILVLLESNTDILGKTSK